MLGTNEWVQPTLLCLGFFAILPLTGAPGSGLERHVGMNNELLAVLEYLERERGLDRETLIRAVEEALLTASRKSIRSADDLKVVIDRKTFDIKAIGHFKVVERVLSPGTEMPLGEARRIKADAKLGDIVEVEVTPDNFGRIAAQTAKQAIMQRIRQAERDKIFEEFKDRPGDIVSGVVRRFEGRDVVLELGRAEALMPGSERIPTEDFKAGDRIRALVLKVEKVTSGPEIVVSRASADFVRRLFELEIAEIADRTVEIRAIAREPGFRTKIGVASRDEKVDPVGACVGMKGMRVKNIVRELSGEKVDVVRWNDDIRTYIANALAPAKLLKINIEESTRTVTIKVASDQLSLAIGKKGQNARLTSKLTGWRVDIERETEDISFEEKVRMAVEALASVGGIGPERAEKLVQAGFLTLEGILAADLVDLETVDGFDSKTAADVHAAAEKEHARQHPEYTELDRLEKQRI